MGRYRRVWRPPKALFQVTDFIGWEDVIVKIVDVKPILVDHYLLVEVTTDDGLVGLGESGAWGFIEASEAAVGKFAEYLIGKDPLLIEHHWQYMYRATHFRGAAIMGALSAIDIALWDIA